MERPRVSPIINYGAVLQTCAVLISVGTLIWYFAVAAADNRATAATVGKIQPVVEANTKANIQQEAQLAMLTQTLADLRAANSAMMAKLMSISEDVSAIKARQK